MSETIPPMTWEDLQKALRIDSWKSYIYIGDAGDRGWEIAQLAHNLVPRLRVYLATDPEELKKGGLAVTQPGIVFGFDDSPYKYLSKREAEDLATLVTAVAEAGS